MSSEYTRRSHLLNSSIQVGRHSASRSEESYASRLPSSSTASKYLSSRATEADVANNDDFKSYDSLLRRIRAEQAESLNTNTNTNSYLATSPSRYNTTSGMGGTGPGGSDGGREMFLHSRHQELMRSRRLLDSNTFNGIGTTGGANFDQQQQMQQEYPTSGTGDNSWRPTYSVRNIPVRSLEDVRETIAIRREYYRERLFGTGKNEEEEPSGENTEQGTEATCANEEGGAATNAEGESREDQNNTSDAGATNCTQSTDNEEIETFKPELETQSVPVDGSVESVDVESIDEKVEAVDPDDFSDPNNSCNSDEHLENEGAPTAEPEKLSNSNVDDSVVLAPGEDEIEGIVSENTAVAISKDNELHAQVNSQVETEHLSQSQQVDNETDSKQKTPEPESNPNQQVDEEQRRSGDNPEPEAANINTTDDQMNVESDTSQYVPALAAEEITATSESGTACIAIAQDLPPEQNTTPETESCPNHQQIPAELNEPVMNITDKQIPSSNIENLENNDDITSSASVSTVDEAVTMDSESQGDNKQEQVLGTECCILDQFEEKGQA